MHRDKLLSSLEQGFGFCDVVLGWDSEDRLYDNVAYTGWHTGYPDVEVRLAPETARRIPFEDRTLLLLGEFAGKAEAICSRGLLKRVLVRAKNHGFHGQIRVRSSSSSFSTRRRKPSARRAIAT